MSRRAGGIVALVAGGLLTLVVLIAFVGVAFGGGIRDRIAGDFQRVGNRGGSEVFRSSMSVPRTVDRIVRGDRPNQQLTDAAGVFLRYPDDIVAVHAARGGGTEIEVDDDDRGYARWYPYVGNYFGRGAGIGESFRGGGPGSGK